MTSPQFAGRYRTATASSLGAKLDSHVVNGGGTDDTKILQQFLDSAPEGGGVHLVMDGASLIRGLRVHSNTIIECIDSTCGFFLADHSDTAVVKNFNRNYVDRIDHDITLIGGSYNQNCRAQRHDGPYQPLPGEELSSKNGDFDGHEWTMGLQFYGVSHLTIRDITIRDQRTFALHVANFEHVLIENVFIDMPGKVPAQNQDGLHFWGPGRFLTLRNIKGDAGDDFIALAPDENDLVSDITDVLIDGVYLNNADQAIRLLSRAGGRLDRVVIRNVTGTFRSYGFYINPWFPGETIGNFGSISIENCDLRPVAPVYDYTPPFLFRIGGSIDHLAVRNLTWLDPLDHRPLFQIGIPFYQQLEEGKAAEYNHIRMLTVDGLTILSDSADTAVNDASYLCVDCPVTMLSVQNVRILRENADPDDGTLIRIGEEGSIGTLNLCGVSSVGLNNLLDDPLDAIGALNKTGIHVQ